MEILYILNWNSLLEIHTMDSHVPHLPPTLYIPTMWTLLKEKQC